MGRKISPRAWEITCQFVRASCDPPNDYQIIVIASQIDSLVRAAARLHRAQEASCNGTMCGRRYESERSRFQRAAKKACAMLGEAAPLYTWECDIGSGDPRGAAGLVRWAYIGGGSPVGQWDWCYGDAWGGGGYVLPGRAAEVEPS